MNTDVIKVALLDDYHGVAERYADWTTLGPQVQVQSFRDYLPEGERAAALNCTIAAHRVQKDKLVHEVVPLLKEAVHKLVFEQGLN